MDKMWLPVAGKILSVDLLLDVDVSADGAASAVGRAFPLSLRVRPAAAGFASWSSETTVPRRVLSSFNSMATPCSPSSAKVTVC